MKLKDVGRLAAVLWVGIMAMPGAARAEGPALSRTDPAASAPVTADTPPVVTASSLGMVTSGTSVTGSNAAILNAALANGDQVIVESGTYWFEQTILVQTATYWKRRDPGVYFKSADNTNTTRKSGCENVRTISGCSFN